jgi:hypothetical protein
VNVEAWCGSCGEGFRLVQVVEVGSGGRCPRCGIAFNHDYNAMVTSASSALIAAADALENAAETIADTAPLLHVDRAALYNALDKHLARER